MCQVLICICHTRKIKRIHNKGWPPRTGCVPTELEQYANSEVDVNVPEPAQRKPSTRKNVKKIHFPLPRTWPKSKTQCRIKTPVSSTPEREPPRSKRQTITPAEITH